MLAWTLVLAVASVLSLVAAAAVLTLGGSLALVLAAVALALGQAVAWEEVPPRPHCPSV